MELSLILPCYNEAPHLEASAREITTHLNACGVDYEIIFVDDRSDDETPQIIKKLVAENHNFSALYHSLNTGRGRAVMDGFKLAKGKYIGFIDIDLEVGARYIFPLLLLLRDGADGATGRRVYKVTLSNSPRWLMTSIYSRLVSRLLRLPLEDTETGFKFFNRETALPVLERTRESHWFWDTEAMYHCWKSGLKIVEMPVLFIKRKVKKSTVKPLADTIYYVKAILKFKRSVNKQAGRHTSGSTQKEIRNYWKHKWRVFDSLYEKSPNPANIAVRSLLMNREKIVRQWLNEVEFSRCLDVGCGTGRNVFHLASMKKEVVGTDLYPEVLAACVSKARVSPDRSVGFAAADAANQPFGRGSFDLVISLGVLDYIDDAAPVIGEISRVLAPGGHAIVSFPAKASPYFFLRGNVGAFLRQRILSIPPITSTFSEGEIENLTFGAGLELLKIRIVNRTMHLTLLAKK